MVSTPTKWSAPSADACTELTVLTCMSADAQNVSMEHPGLLTGRSPTPWTCVGRKGSDLVGLHQAPRFHAYFRHLVGRHVLLMSRVEWEQLSQILRPGELVEIDVSPTPNGAVMRGSRVVAVVATRQSSSAVVIEVSRHDPQDSPKTPINLDRYRRRRPPRFEHPQRIVSGWPDRRYSLSATPDSGLPWPAGQRFNLLA
jgi:hypothetical protein